MENDREVDQVMMNINGTTGAVIKTVMFSAQMSFKLLQFIFRMAKKGLVAAGMSDRFLAFNTTTDGKYTVYNIPVNEKEAEALRKMGELELKLQSEKNPITKFSLRRELSALEKDIPEIEQLKKLGIKHCVLPKLNGSEQTIQIAIAKENDQLFQNWFINHLTTELSGGEKNLEGIKVFTEGNYSIFNMPFENDEISPMLTDFNTLGVNYSVLPDLNVGDGYTQLAIPNSDRSKVEVWFKMWKDKQLQNGEEVKNMYVIDDKTYINSAHLDADAIISSADAVYKEANAEFEEQATDVPWTAALAKENSEEYMRYDSDPMFDKITINKEKLVDGLEISPKYLKTMREKGFFMCRVPWTWGENQQALLLPANRVFRTDDDKTFVAFVPKNEPTYMVNKNNQTSKLAFEEVYKRFAKVERNLNKVKDLQQGKQIIKDVVKNAAKDLIP